MDESRIEVRRSPIHGLGCYASRPIAAGEWIVDYVGEYIDLAEAKRRDVQGSPRYSPYVLYVDEDLFIDAAGVDQPGKYVNHSCDPNSEVRGEGRRAFIVALRDICEGEEITYDYDFGEGPTHPCACGSEKCRGFI
jgi:SET domain-containing protein